MVGNSLNSAGSLKSARAGRASRAGARAGRIVRLVRMVKLYKYYTKNKEKEEHQLMEDHDPDVIIEKKDEVVMPPESHVGAAMSDLTTRRVIILVLCLLISIPLLTFSTVDLSGTYGAELVNSMANNSFPDQNDNVRTL